MVRLAMSYGHPRSVAEQLVADAWSEIFDDVRDFDGSTPLRPWLFRRVLRRAVAGSDGAGGAAGDEPPVDPRRFYGPQTRWPGHWRETADAMPVPWTALTPLADEEKAAFVQSAIERLPARMRQVVVLRDVDGWSADDVRLATDVPETEQASLLARARSAIRADLERRARGVAPGRA